MAITPTSAGPSEQAPRASRHGDVAERPRRSPTARAIAGHELQRLAKRHLWMHFTRMGAYEEAPRSR